MEFCKHCGAIRDDHVGVNETCPRLPAQRFERIPATRKCAAWRGCGNVEVPISDLSFRGFCPDCERVTTGG